MGKPASQRSRQLAPGDKLGKYDLIRQIAIGGMAELYLARTVGIEGFEKLVVVKRILPQHASNASFVEMFLNEARLAATLQHPNVAQVYDIGVDGGDYFFAMEYVHGEDLDQMSAQARDEGVPIALDAALTLISHLCAGLHYAHEKLGPDGKPLEIVHRDVSPSNVLVSYDGAVKLVDFGIARATKKQTTTRGGLKGKIAYMSPEQCRASGQLDRRSDLFSVGMILYELTTGQLPFTGETEYQLLDQIVNCDVPRPSALVPSYPPALEQIVLRALARDRTYRYSTALELQGHLEDFAHESRLRVSPLVLARLMSSLYPARLEEWAHAKAQGVFFVEQHVVRTLIEDGKTPDPNDPALRAAHDGIHDDAEAEETAVDPLAQDTSVDQPPFHIPPGAMTPSAALPRAPTPPGATPAGPTMRASTPAGMTPSGPTLRASTPSSMTPSGPTMRAMTPPGATPPGATPRAGTAPTASLRVGGERATTERSSGPPAMTPPSAMTPPGPLPRAPTDPRAPTPLPPPPMAPPARNTPQGMGASVPQRNTPSSMAPQRNTPQGMGANAPQRNTPPSTAAQHDTPSGMAPQRKTPSSTAPHTPSSMASQRNTPSSMAAQRNTPPSMAASAPSPHAPMRNTPIPGVPGAVPIVPMNAGVLVTSSTSNQPGIPQTPPRASASPLSNVALPLPAPHPPAHPEAPPTAATPVPIATSYAQADVTERVRVTRRASSDTNFVRAARKRSPLVWIAGLLVIGGGLAAVIALRGNGTPADTASLAAPVRLTAPTDETKPAPADETKPAPADETKVAAPTDETKPAPADETKPAPTDETKPAPADESKVAAPAEPTKPADAEAKIAAPADEPRPATDDAKPAVATKPAVAAKPEPPADDTKTAAEAKPARKPRPTAKPPAKIAKKPVANPPPPKEPKSWNADSPFMPVRTH